MTKLRADVRAQVEQVNPTAVRDEKPLGFPFSDRPQPAAPPPPPTPGPVITERTKLEMEAGARQSAAWAEHHQAHHSAPQPAAGPPAPQLTADVQHQVAAVLRNFHQAVNSDEKMFVLRRDRRSALRQYPQGLRVQIVPP
jgi:hypothetical protein